MSDVVASVVIGFKDWGLDRLDRCIRSVRSSFGDIPAEVIVSDYGSADGGSVEEISVTAGARYVRTETDGTWSRSRALNAGFAVAEGSQLFATDADMIFTPTALSAVSKRLTSVPHEAIILQCRDLPPDVGTESVEDIDWSRCERVATIRPRWGMGGLVATRRELFGRLRGYDERMHTYGGEDIDYGKRLKRLGTPINWFDQPGVRMYHVWHPSSRLAASLDQVAENAIAHNRRIHSEDSSTVRNRILSEHLEGTTPPIVTIVAAADRQPEHLTAELSNILGQTVSNIEILLVDTNGHGQSLAEQLDDDRVRLTRTGARAWWHALENARGTYALLHASGSWCAPDRLERLLSHTEARHVMPSDVAITAISSDDGQLQALPLSEGAPQLRPWSSMLFPTDTVRTVLATLGADSSDPHDLVFALLRNGLTVSRLSTQWRVQVTDNSPAGELELEDFTRQAHHLMRRLRSAEVSDDWMPSSLSPLEVNQALSSVQELMRDQLDILVWSSDENTMARLLPLAEGLASVRQSSVTDPSGQTLFRMAQVAGLPGASARQLQREAALSMSQGGTRIEIVTDDAPVSAEPPVARLIQEYSRLYAGEPGTAMWVVARTSTETSAAAAMTGMGQLAGITVALHRVMHDDQAETEHVVLGLTGTLQGALETFLAVRATAGEETSVDLWLGEALRDITLTDLVGEAS